MTRPAITFATVCRIARQVPGVEEGTSWRGPALTLGGRMIACMAIHPSAEPGSLMVRLPIAERDELVAADPDVYYLTEHYEPHPALLVRLSRVHPDALHDLLGLAARHAAEKHPPRRAARKA